MKTQRLKGLLLSVSAVILATQIGGCATNGSPDLGFVGAFGSILVGAITGDPEAGRAFGAGVKIADSLNPKEATVRHRQSEDFSSQFVGLVGEAMYMDHEYRMAPRRRTIYHEDASGFWSVYEAEQRRR